MIEVEKKFILSKEEIEKLVKGSQFVKEVKLDDIYYDLPGFLLIKHDKYLRSRNGKFELKIPIKSKNLEADHYRELDNESDIKKELSLSGEDIQKEIEVAGYFTVANIKSVRRKYKNGDFNIDVDATDFGYSVVEIELMVSDENEVDKAVGKIIKFAKVAGLEIKVNTDTRGKVMEYLYRQSPKVYEEVVEFWRSADLVRL